MLINQYVLTCSPLGAHVGSLIKTLVIKKNYIERKTTHTHHRLHYSLMYLYGNVEIF